MLVKILSYSNFSSFLGIKRQLEQYVMAYPDAVASDIRPLSMFCEIIASNMISHDRVTDSKCFPINDKICEIIRTARVLSMVNMCV